MGRRSKIYELPSEIRTELDSRLIDRGFGGYRELVGWLSERGYDIRKSTLTRYSQRLEEEYAAALSDVIRIQNLAEAYMNANPDEHSALTGASVRIAQDSLLRIAIKLRNVNEDPMDMARAVSNISRAIADLGRLDILRERWVIEQRHAGAAALAERASAEGNVVSTDRLREIAREIYGI